MKKILNPYVFLLVCLILFFGWIVYEGYQAYEDSKTSPIGYLSPLPLPIETVSSSDPSTTGSLGGGVGYATTTDSDISITRSPVGEENYDTLYESTTSGYLSICLQSGGFDYCIDTRKRESWCAEHNKANLSYDDFKMCESLKDMK